MMGTRWDRDFLASTRGRIVRALCCAANTAEELAQALGVTQNAIRAQLAALERDGFAHPVGFRRGERRPSRMYRLTPQAERLFPRAYAALLRRLLDVLAQRMPPEELAAVLREVGRRAGAELGAPGGADLRSRVRRGAAVLEELGGVTQVEGSGVGLVIRGSCCPLSAIVGDRPEGCLIAEALLAQVIGAPVREACGRGDPPRCAFRVEAA